MNKKNTKQAPTKKEKAADHKKYQVAVFIHIINRILNLPRRWQKSLWMQLI